MDSDDDGSSYERSSKTYGSSSKLAYTRWMEQVCVCVSIYISTLGMYSLYVCHTCMCRFLYTYINSSKVHKTKLYRFEIQS